MPHRAPGASGPSTPQYLAGKPITYYRPRGSAEVRALIDEGFQAFNAARLSEACRIYTDKMLAPESDTTIGLTVAGALTPAGLGGCIVELMERGLVDFLISTGANLYHDLHYALNFTLHRGSPFVNDVDLYEQGIIRIYDVLFPATVLLETDSYVRDFLVRFGVDEPIASSELHYRLGLDLLERQPGCEEYSVLAAAAKYGVPIYTSSPGDSSIGMNIAYHELITGSRLMIDPNRDVNEVCAIVLAGNQNGCVILGGGSPKNFYLQAQPTLWEVYSIPKGGNDYFIQFTTDQVVWGGLSGATPAEAVSWGKVNPGVLPDTAVCYADSTIAFPLFAEYAVGSRWNRRERRELIHKRASLVATLKQQADGCAYPPRKRRRSIRRRCRISNGTADGQPRAVRDDDGHSLQRARASRRATRRPARLRGRQHAGRHRGLHARAAALGRALRHGARRPPPRRRPAPLPPRATVAPHAGDHRSRLPRRPTLPSTPERGGARRVGAERAPARSHPAPGRRCALQARGGHATGTRCRSKAASSLRIPAGRAR